MKIGIFGGSFDPPHKEHFNIAIHSINALGLDRLFVLPARIPPHKPFAILTDGQSRLNMLKLMFADEKKVEVSDFELNSSEKSYTYLTINHYKSLYENSQIYLIMGADMLENFPTWKNPQNILDNAFLYVYGRTGDSLKIAKDTFIKKFGSLNNVIFDSYVGQNVSSTDIKNRLMLGLDVGDKLDKKVLDYVTKNNLYTGNSYSQFITKNLPISRLTHTLGVMNLAKKYAFKLGIDTNKALLAAMLHDSAKYLNPSDYPSFVWDKTCPSSVVHQFLGAYVVENVLNITDQEIINAIKYHTTGRKNMSELERVIFLADMLEEGRNYDSVDYLRNSVEEDFDEGFKICVKYLYDHLKSQTADIYYLTKECYEYYYLNKKD